jgi:hypothetical protein
MIDYTAFFLGALGFFVAPVVLAFAVTAGATATSSVPLTINPATGINIAGATSGARAIAIAASKVFSTLYGAASTVVSAFLPNKLFKNDNILISYSLSKADAFLCSIFSFN